jgi:hypothetical protein
VGQQNNTQSIVFLVLLLYFSTVLSAVSAAQDATLSIHMLQGEQQTRFNAPVLVSGIWHYVNITTDQSIGELSLRFYKGTVIPSGAKNETNYYEWNYNKNTASVWSDVSGYGIKYIQQDLCHDTNTMYSFCIGIKDFMPNIVDYYENWTAEVSSLGTMIRSETIVIEKPKTGVSLSKPSSIIFHVDPFTIMDAVGDNFFKIGNIGNIPLSINFDNERYSDVEINDMNTKLLPEEIITHYVTVHSRSWPPGFKTIDIQLNGSYPRLYFVDTNATVTLYTSFIIDVPQLIIYVGHSNYKIDELQGTGITFQYIENLNMYEGEIRDLTAYVSGNGAVTAELWADEKNISVMKLYDDGIETHSPLSFSSTNTSERIIKVTVKALSEGTTGILTYRISANGISKTYTTQISIGPPESPDDEDTGGSFSIMQFVVVGIVVLVLVYMIVTYLRNRKR